MRRCSKRWSCRSHSVSPQRRRWQIRCAAHRLFSPPLIPPARSTARPPVWALVLGGFVLLVGCMIGLGVVLPAIRGDGPTSMPDMPTGAASTSTPWIVVATATSGSVTPTQALSTATLVLPTPDPRIPAQGIVERFQDARATAYSTWNTDQYYSVLAGNALESALQTITQLKNTDCRYYVSDNSQMRFRYEDVSANRVVVIVSRSETQRRICAGSTSYTCYDFNGRYVVECKGDQWYITEKSVQNLAETSPCP